VDYNFKVILATNRSNNIPHPAHPEAHAPSSPKLDRVLMTVAARKLLENFFPYKVPAVSQISSSVLQNHQLRFKCGVRNIALHD